MAHVEALSWTTQTPKRPKGHDEAQATAPEEHGEGAAPRAMGLTPAPAQQLLFVTLHPSAQGLKVWLSVPYPLPLAAPPPPLTGQWLG